MNIGKDIARMAKVLEDECERLGYGRDERKIFFDLMWDYSEHAMVSKDRRSVIGWEDDDVPQMPKTCCLCQGRVAYATRLVRDKGNVTTVLASYNADMELYAGELTVVVVDGDRQYLAKFRPNYCPCCGRNLRDEEK